MADLEKTVAIIFEGVDQMGAGVDSATRQIDGIAGAVQNATGPLANFTTDIFKLEAALLATGVAVTGFAIKLAGDFDSQFREISTLIDAPTESLAGFRQEILDYSTESTQALDTINSAIYSAISAGVDYTDSLDVIRIAERAAVAGKADLDQALGVIVSSLNAYGAGMDQAEHFADLLFATVKNGVTTLPELGSSLGQVTGIAASAGVSFDELLAAIATLTSTGSTTSGAVTQVQNAISNLLSPTERAKNLADELGIEFNASALASKGLAGVLQDVGEATGGNVEQMAQLFGSVQALNGVLTLTGMGAETFTKSLEENANAAGALQEAYEKMAGQISDGNQRIINAMKGALIAVGEPLLEEFGGIQEAIAAIFNAIGASISGGQLQGFVDQIESLFQGIERTLRDVAANLPAALEQADFSAFFNGIELVRDAIAGLFDGADLTSADGLARVIETLGLGFETLAAYTAGAIEALIPFIGLVIDLAQWVLELDPALIAVVGSVGGLAVALNTLGGAVTTVTGLIRAFAGSSGVIAKAAPIIGSLVTVLTGPVGLAVAAGLVGTAVVRAGADILGFSDNIDDATREIMEQNRAIDEGRLVWDTIAKDWVAAGEAQETLTEQVERWNRETRDTILGIDRQAEARRRELQVMDEVNHAYTNYDAIVEDAWRSSEGFSAEQERTASALRDVLENIGPLGPAWEEVSDGVFQQVTNIEALQGAVNDAKDALEAGLISQSQFDEIEDFYNSLMDGAENGRRAQEALADEVLTTEEAILKARQGVLDYNLALEELASNERIKEMEFNAAINIAALEADAKKVEAILNATSTTITELGAATSDMFGTLASGDLSRWHALDLERAIDQQLDIQREAADQQKELIDAQIDMFRARADALRSGEGLIKISSDGLEPALEMIMWEIIQKVQLRANAEGAEFLLGLPSGGE